MSQNLALSPNAQEINKRIIDKITEINDLLEQGQRQIGISVFGELGEVVIRSFRDAGWKVTPFFSTTGGDRVPYVRKIVSYKFTEPESISLKDHCISPEK